MFTFVKNIIHSLVDWIFPPRLSERIAYTLHSTDILSLPHAHPIDAHTHALFSYKDPRVTSLIWEIKYHKNTQVLSLIIPLLADVIREEYSNHMIFENWHECFLVPVPSTATHIREHGYSHTQFICEALLPHLPTEITYAPHLLKKIIETPRQHRLKDRNARLHNLTGSQVVTAVIPPHTAVLLIDDVTTTGATLNESRRALKEVGVKHILSFTIAH